MIKLRNTQHTGRHYRVDGILFIASIAILIAQWATNTGWLLVPWGIALAGAVIVPAKWTIGRTRMHPDDGGFLQ